MFNWLTFGCGMNHSSRRKILVSFKTQIRQGWEYKASFESYWVSCHLWKQLWSEVIKQKTWNNCYTKQILHHFSPPFPKQSILIILLKIYLIKFFSKTISHYYFIGKANPVKKRFITAKGGSLSKNLSCWISAGLRRHGQYNCLKKYKTPTYWVGQKVCSVFFL